MANKFELTIDLTNRKFVTSRYDSSTFTLDKLYQGDVLPLRIRLVTPKEDGGLTSPFDLVTAGSIELAIVTPNSSSPAVLATTGATSIAADGSDYYADATLSLNTSEIDGLTYAGNTSPATTTIEAEYINGSNNLTAIQQSIQIQPHGIDSGASAPSPSSSYYTQAQTDANDRFDPGNIRTRAGFYCKCERPCNANQKQAAYERDGFAYVWPTTYHGQKDRTDQRNQHQQRHRTRS